jgi:hypothetical protein
MDEILAHLRETAKKSYLTNNWGARHVAAWEGSVREVVDRSVRLREVALKQSIIGWALIGDTHEQMFESKMGDDGFLGPEWKKIGKGLRAQLNGQCGRFDCGTLDALICNIARACGVNLDE